MKNSSSIQTKAVLSSTPAQTGLLQRKCTQCDEKDKLLQRQAVNQSEISDVPPIVHDALNAPGQPLDPSTRALMEPRFGHDFSQVQVHTDSQAVASAQAVNAMAYTVGNHIAFSRGRYQPQGSEGQHLIAHELAHVVQQSSSSMQSTDGTAAQEAEADQAADAVVSGTSVPNIGQINGIALQRKVEMRDVGRGEQSGFARLPELIDRLNAMSTGLTFSMSGNELVYEQREGGTLNNFDRQMMAFIDQDRVIPLRLTNRHGLLGNHASGFHDRVDVDAWTSGYVDIDDLLASSNLGLQSVLVHFLRERSATSNYARRIGTTTFTNAEFNRVHSLGIEAEAELLRDFFNDPTIRIVNDSPSPTIRRVFRNSRGDLIRRRVRIGRGDERGVDAMSIDVRTRDGRTLTAEECRGLLAAAPIAP
ncbi:MAG TPA: DUF4157 domain-containing protein [Trichocoleus sp.]